MVIIATVSPSSKDTEHSLNTIRHACIMDGQGETKVKGSEHTAGGTVTKQKLGEVDVTKIARERREQKKRGSTEESADWGQAPAPPAHQAKKSNTGARTALDKRCVNALPQQVREELLNQRAKFGNERQRLRLYRPAPASAWHTSNDVDPRADRNGAL